MTDLGEALLARLGDHWTRAGVTPNKGAPGAAVEQLKQRYNVALPDDFAQYLLSVNGVDVAAPPPKGSRYRFAEKDRDGFSFWPLERITRASEGEAPQSFPGANHYFVFADHMDWSWAYAIRLDRDTKATNPVVIVGTKSGQPQELASSFTEFIELYLKGYKHIWIRE